MRLVKYIVILLFVLFGCYSAGWYYISNKILSEINSKYSGQKFNIKALHNEEYFISFDRANSKGFPFQLVVSLEGWKEESKGALISYNSPVNIGYNFVTRSVYISYDGEIDAAYKPVANGFGAKLKIKDYLIKIALPLTKASITNISKMKDPIELVNYIGDINISTKEVQIFDKQEGDLFYHKDSERLRFSFVPAKYYEHFDDLLNNIPKEYKIYYLVKTKPVEFASRRIPVSLFYGFSLLPSNFNATASVSIKTTAKTFKELSSNLDLQSDCTFSTSLIDLTSFKLDFKNSQDPTKGNNVKLVVDSQIRLKTGLFDELFKQYETIKPTILNAPAGHLINQEVSYIIANKNEFRFKDLENSDYILNIDMASSDGKTTTSMKLNNFSIYSGESGIKLTHESIMRLNNQANWNAKGVLLLKNYPAVVDFSSGYIYRFGKFRFLNDQARKLYVEVNKAFLKEISDHPTSTSNDLSFDYDADSNNFPDAKIGSVKIDQIAQLYQLMLYKKLFGAVDPHGDILKQMKKILPDLNENDSMFKKLFPKITGKELNELLPKNAKDTIEKILPTKELKKKVGKDLLKMLGK